MNRFSDKFVRFLGMVMTVLLNPLVGALLWIIESIVFVVLLCLLIIGRMSLWTFLLLLASITLLPLLGWLCLLGALQFLQLSLRRKEADQIDKRSGTK